VHTRHLHLHFALWLISSYMKTGNRRLETIFCIHHYTLIQQSVAHIQFLFLQWCQASALIKDMHIILNIRNIYAYWKKATKKKCLALGTPL